MKWNISNANEYIAPEKLEIINDYLRKRKDLSYIEELKRDWKLSENDIEVILQDRTIQTLWNITALDVIISSVPKKVKENLLDPDIFPLKL